MAVTGLPAGRLNLRSQGSVLQPLTLALGLLKLAQLLVVGSERVASNQKLLAGVKVDAKIQRVHAPLLDVVQCAVKQLKLLVKPSPALALG
ncbi:hypothetical protein HMPREF0045_00260 [Actinomyces graevenitzii C83]|jgi:hypothetical protein|uniref:Uncharacterized protein n=1 Tax=Actinomyces graevenitzii C83 TaxID=435830 RepID=G9PCY1_9ACTO|nr:hypothetical protein HMPREF0045_00260 [Actinomyces graevenitzii C83]